MQKRLLCGKEVTLLGMGAMRLPVNEEGFIDRVKAEEMIDYIYKSGVNYYDTAYVYHKGESEEFLGDVLSKYPRESFYLATKTPGHLVNPNYDPKEAFERQLRRCKTDYFDFYLLHNVMESSLNTYTDKDLRVMDYLLEQKAKGKIKHIGLSTHGQLKMIEDYLRDYGKDIEFIQLQLNYLDWTLQQGKEKYELAERLGLPVIVMEPLRGGKLASLDEESEKMMREINPNDSAASWAIRFAASLPNVATVLSGMTTLEQVVDNVKTIENFKPISAEENIVLDKIRDKMLDLVPCTACRYCVDGCPMELDIPYLLNIYNDAKFTPAFTPDMVISALDENKKPSACIGCGLCSKVCPQHIDIPKALADFNKLLSEGPNWEKTSAVRIMEDRK